MKDVKQFLMTIIINSKGVEETKTLVKQFEQKVGDITIGKNDAFIAVVKVNEIDRPFNEQ